MKNSLLVSGIIALVVSGVIWGLLPAKSTITTVDQSSPKTLGSAGNDLATPWFRFGGILRYANSMVMNVATTTNCSLPSPSATSTLTNFTARFDNGTSTTPTFFVAQTSAPSGTTTATTQGLTQIFTGAGVANETGRIIDLVATSTSAGVAPLWIFPPNSYVSLAMAGGIGTFSPSGECKASWLSH
jgi:hypothetical protein